MSAKSTGDRKLDSLRDRAASRIIWGEREEDVYKFLRKEGVAPELADQFLEEARKERATIIRQRCLIKFVVGAIGAVVCGGLLLYFEFFSGVRFYGTGYYRLFWALCIGLAISGGFAAQNGFSLLTGKTRGSAMDD